MDNKNFSVFSNNELGSVRVVYKDNEPWFIANDVCKCLLVTNSRDALRRLDDDEKGVVLTDTLGGAQKMSVINESGLYALIMSSRKKEAREFQKWVTRDVLPSIRKNGGYILGQEKLSSAELERLSAEIKKLSENLSVQEDYSSLWEEMYFRLMKDYEKAVNEDAPMLSVIVEEQTKTPSYIVTPEGWIIDKKLIGEGS